MFYFTKYRGAIPKTVHWDKFEVMLIDYRYIK